MTIERKLCDVKKTWLISCRALARSVIAWFACLALGSLALVGNANAALTINSVTLNGAASVTVSAGASITVVVTETNTGGSNWGSVRIRTTDSGGNRITTCIDTPDHNGNGTYTETFIFTAPAAADTYDVSVRASSSNSCGGTNSSNFPLTGGIVVVTGPPNVTSINRASFDPTAANAVVSWTVIFDQSVTGVNSTDFALVQAGGATGASVSSVSGSGTTWTVTANTGTGTVGTVRLDLIDNDSIVAGGLALGGPGAGNGNFSGQTYTLQTICTGAFPQIFCDDFERTNAGVVGNGWTVTPANTDATCSGAAGNTGCAGIDSDIPPFNNYANPRANSTRSMFTRWNVVSVDSPVINLAGRPAALLSFWMRRGSDTFSECPEAAGENYLVEFWDGTAWQILAQYPSSPSAALCGNGPVVTPVIQLPPSALHAGFKLRFYQPSGSGKTGAGGATGVVGYDYWHMDNVIISEAPASSFSGPFCDNFEGGLGRWSISAEGAPPLSGTVGGPAIGDASLGTGNFSSAGNDLDMRWGYVVASTLRTDMTGATGNINYWLKAGASRATGQDLVVEYFNSAGTWTALATYPGSAAVGTIYNGNHVLPADARHAGFRLRFRLLAGGGYDLSYWHLDDVCVGTIIPTADLALTKNRSVALVPGTNVPYILTVTNNGPGTLAGSMQVVDTLPAGLSYYSASGTGWACSAVGQVVTCNWSGTLASAATAPPLTLTAAVAIGATGTLTNTATVTGTVVDNTPGNNTATNTGSVIVATLLAEYRMEDASWGVLTDVAGYAGGPFNGSVTGTPGPTPAFASPALGSIPGSGTCGYASMPGPSAGGGAFTISGLPVSTAAGDKTSVAFWMYWDGTDGVMPIGWDKHDLLLQGGSFGFSTADTDIYGISSANLANGWHHVVAVFTNGSVSSNQLYVDGVLKTLTQRLGAPNLGNATVGSTLQIGGWTQDGLYRFSGRIDEVKIYKDALDQAAVTAIYGETHACVAAVDHYELSLPSSGITCLPSTAIVTACADGSSPCTNPSALVSGRTAALTANAGTLGASTVTFNASGVANTTLSYPAASDGTAATVTLSGEQVTAINARKCCPDGANCVVANSCTTTFNTAGFIFSSSVGGGVATIGNQVAGTSSGTYYLRAVKTIDNSAHTCGAAFSGAQTINFAYECNDPATCYASDLMSVNGGTATTIARNNNLSVSAYTPVNMTFDVNGNAPFAFVYSDVGQVTLWANATVNSAVLTKSSNAFVVRPGGFVLSNIVRTSDSFANPAAADASGARFIKAGEAFSATVTATTTPASGALTTRNYGQESVREGVKLTTALVPSPDLSANPTLGGTFGTFANGVATGASFVWNEVGIITLTPSVLSGNYLGAGDTQGTTSGNVGRFIPDHFGVTGSVVTRSDLQTTEGQVTPFTYMGEPMKLSLAVTAYNMTEGATQNYKGGFAKLNASDLGSSNLAKWTCTSPAPCMGLAAVFGSTALTSRLLIDTTSTNSAVPSNTTTAGGATSGWSGGTSYFTLFSKFARAAAPDGPYGDGLTSFLKIGGKPLDTDGVTLPPRNLTPTDPTHCVNLDVTTGTENAACNPGATEVNLRRKLFETTQRFGRLSLQNMYGSEKLPLAIPLQAQYWSGSYFINNAGDSLTPISAPAARSPTGTVPDGAANLYFYAVTARNQLLPADAVPTVKTMADVVTNKLSGGQAKLQFAAPLKIGWLDLILQVPDYLRYNLGNCNGQIGAAGLLDDLPCARAAFGTYKSPLIYRRENY